MSEDYQRREYVENHEPIIQPSSPDRAAPSADGDTNSIPPVGANSGDTALTPYAQTPIAPLTSTEPVETQVVEPAAEAPVTVPVKPRKSFWREVLETVILTILIFFLVKSLVQNFRIQGTSMEPNFHTDQYILVNKVAYFHVDTNSFKRLIPGVKADGVHNVWLFGGPQRGDVIVFQYPKAPQDDYIKRVIGFPGECVSVHQNIAYINHQPLSEPYIRQEPAYAPDYPSANPSDCTIVPADELFVLGDNRNGSSDSRSWGFLPIDNIIGKAWIDYWPAFKQGWGPIPEIHSGFAK